MASGHMNRINRPNTWLPDQCCTREESPCQLGAVHTWHLASFRQDAEFGCYRGIADMVRLAPGSTGPRMTQSGHERLRIAAVQTDP
jgi:hypothetical protein